MTKKEKRENKTFEKLIKLIITHLDELYLLSNGRDLDRCTGCPLVILSIPASAISNPLSTSFI